MKLVGTKSADSEIGGAPSNQYGIADPRIVRMLDRRLYDPEVLIEAELEGDDEEDYVSPSKMGSSAE